MKTLDVKMVDYVIEQTARFDSDYAYTNIIEYAEFLKQPLCLGMFVPLAEDGNLLLEPKWDNKDIIKPYEYFINGMFGVLHPTSKVDEKAREIVKKCKQYQNALDKLIFKGFTFDLEDKVLNYLEPFTDGHFNLLWNEKYNCFVDDFFLEDANFYKTIEDLIPFELPLSDGCSFLSDC